MVGGKNNVAYILRQYVKEIILCLDPLCKLFVQWTNVVAETNVLLTSEHGQTCQAQGTFDANLDMLKSWVLDCSSRQEDEDKEDAPSLVKGQGCLFTPPRLTERQKREIFKR